MYYRLQILQMHTCVLFVLMALTSGRCCVAQGLSKEMRDLAAAGLAHLEKEEWAQAEKMFARMLDEDPNALPAWFRLGYSQQKQGKHQQALASYEKALEHPGTRAIAMYHSACIYCQMNRTEQAIVWLRRAVEAGFINYETMINDDDLRSLKNDERFTAIVKDCKAKANKANRDVMSVAILVYDGVELLDFAGPGEVFSICRKADGRRAFRVWTVAVTEDSITSNGFVELKPTYSVQNCPQPDIVVVPGGITLRAEDDHRLVNWLKEAGGKSKKVMSVCTGVFLLDRAGHLKDFDVTTHWRAIDSLKKVAGERFNVVEDARYVDAGKVITSAGVSAGIDAALHLVEQIHGKTVAERTAKQMEYQRSDFRSEK